ncbi:MAG: hypothetical protein H0T79_14410 [Deltaproteobacteria bacterium]|nr:hypothetical protein [Deltaproteobacteria bacterium]
MRPSRLGFVLLAIVGSCSTDSTEGKHNKNGKDAPPPGPAMTGKKPLAMRNCPSAVPGAITRSTRTADGIEVTITAADLETQREVLARAERQMRFGARRMAPEHSALHGGPETIGYCPIIHTNTTVVAEPLADGVRIRMTPRSRDDLTSLQDRVSERVRALAPPSS